MKRRQLSSSDSCSLRDTEPSHGAAGALFSGSGAAVFGVFRAGKEAAGCADAIAKQKCWRSIASSQGEYPDSILLSAKKGLPLKVAPDKKTLKKSVKSMFFMAQTRCEVETIKY